jgi:hypothetical protein
VSSAPDPRAVLAELSHTLRVLHQRLIAVTQKDFEKLYGRVPGAGALLKLLVDDPLFAWLRPLSRVIADLDELAEADEIDPSVVERARRAVLTLIDEPGEFRNTYLVHLQADPDVVMAHADLRRLLPPQPRDS